jgi:hypothetical protein
MLPNQVAPHVTAYTPGVSRPDSVEMVSTALNGYNPNGYESNGRAHN